jgi:hypothetical protein
MTTPWQEYKKKLGDTRPWHVVHKDNHTDEETAKARMDICETCPSLLKLTHQCKECGCFMKLKTKLIEAVCPLGKW